MRIGMITYGLDRNPTGIGRYTVELARALQRLPTPPEVVLLTTEATDSHQLWADFEHYPLPGCRLLPGLMTLGNLALRYAMHRYGLDLLHDPNGVAPFWMIGREWRRVVTIHDAFAYVHPETHNRLDNWRYRYMLPHTAQRADLVLTDSQHSRHDLSHYLGLSLDKIQVIPCGIHPHFQPHANPQVVLTRYGITRPYLLYVGGINARKNIARLLQAFAQIHADYPNHSLVICGQRQWQTAEIEATLHELDLTKTVLFTGYVPDEDLPALYSAAALFVFPSLYEGFGLPVLEAMACGTPVITSNRSSLPELVADAALQVNPYDVAEIAAAIRQVLDIPDCAANLRARGLARARQFTWEQTARQTIAAYESIL